MHVQVIHAFTDVCRYKMLVRFVWVNVFFMIPI